MSQGPRESRRSGDIPLECGGQTTLNLSSPISAMKAHYEPLHRVILESHV